MTPEESGPRYEEKILSFLTQKAGKRSWKGPLMSFTRTDLMNVTGSTRIWREAWREALAMKKWDVRDPDVKKVFAPIRSAEIEKVEAAISKLLSEGSLARTPNGRYRLPDNHPAHDPRNSGRSRVLAEVRKRRHCKTCRCHTMKSVASEMGVTLEKPREGSYSREREMGS